jgi:excisionase family DNA binding protein
MMPEPLPDRLYTVAEVARYFGKSVPTVYRLVQRKKLRASKIGGEWRISDEAVCKLLEDGMNVKK